MTIKHQECKTCEIISEVLGKRLLERFFLKNRKLEKEAIIALIKDLDIQLVGGLSDRGWTEHDIDVIGDARSISILAKRLHDHKVYNPIHVVGSPGKHSHFLCLWNGLKLIFNG